MIRIETGPITLASLKIRIDGQASCGIDDASLILRSETVGIETMALPDDTVTTYRWELTLSSRHSCPKGCMCVHVALKYCIESTFLECTFRDASLRPKSALVLNRLDDTMNGSVSQLDTCIAASTRFDF